MTHTLESLLELSKTPEGIQQIRIMVAELDGWKVGPSLYHEGLLSLFRPDGEQMGSSWALKEEAWTQKHYGFPKLPKYPEDLNAVHTIVLKIKGDNRSLYCDYLALQHDFTGKDHKLALWEVKWFSHTATALQRCIALILTLQKP